MPSCMPRAYTLGSVMTVVSRGVRRAGRAARERRLSRAVARDGRPRHDRDLRGGGRLRAARGVVARARLLRAGRREPRCRPVPGLRPLVDDPAARTRPRHPSRARCRSPPVPSGPTGYVVNNDNADDDAADPGSALSFGPWRRTWAPRDYADAVERVRDAIARGDVYQVNLVQHLAAEFSGDPGALAARLATLNPHNREPFRGDGWSIVSGSPELFLARRGRRVWTCPIKGTRPAGAGAARELARSAKDAAEHVMIVDLERNDLSRVCEPGSVRWPELMVTRAHGGSRAHGLDRGGHAARRTSGSRSSSRRRSPAGRSRAHRRSRPSI